MQKTAAGNKKALNFFLGGFGLLSAYGCAYQLKQYYESRTRWTRIYDDLGKFQAQDVKGQDAKYYPWYRTGNLENWEYKLVKLTGYFREERFFVRKEREGRKGYFVFAPFITAVEDYDPLRTNTANPPVEHGLFVNLGWVPLENKDDITRSTDPLPLLEPSTEDLPEADKHTGFLNNPENPIEEEVLQLTTVTGLVRQGEKENWLVGNRNFPKEGTYRFIDLPFMSRLSRLFNYDASSTAYIERLIEKYDEDTEANYPIPATKETFYQPRWMPNKHLELATLFGGISALSITTLVLNGLK